MFMPKMPAISVGGRNSAVTIASACRRRLVSSASLRGDLLLQQVRAVAHRDDLVVEPVEALRSLPAAMRSAGSGRRVPSRSMRWNSVRSPTSCRCSRTVVRRTRPSFWRSSSSAPGQHLVLDRVEIARRACRSMRSIASATCSTIASSSAGHASAARRPAAIACRAASTACSGCRRAADQQPLRHGKMQMADLVAGAIEVAHQVGEDAVDAVVRRVKLLVSCRARAAAHAAAGSQVCGAKPVTGARIGEVEMQPDPAVVARRAARRIAGQFFGACRRHGSGRPRQARPRARSSARSGNVGRKRS